MFFFLFIDLFLHFSFLELDFYVSFLRFVLRKPKPFYQMAVASIHLYIFTFLGDFSISSYSPCSSYSPSTYSSLFIFPLKSSLIFPSLLVRLSLISISFNLPFSTSADFHISPSVSLFALCPFPSTSSPSSPRLLTPHEVESRNDAS